MVESGPVTPNKNHIEVGEPVLCAFSILFAVQGYSLTWEWATFEVSTQSKFLYSLSLLLR